MSSGDDAATRKQAPHLWWCVPPGACIVANRVAQYSSGPALVRAYFGQIKINACTWRYPLNILKD